MNRCKIMPLLVLLCTNGLTADDLEEVYIGESVISASGYEQKIKDAPATISVITKEDLQTRPIRDLGDAVQDIPGVYVENTKTGGSEIKMRGFGTAYTLILIDGKRQSVTRSSVSGGFYKNGFSGVASSFMPPVSMIERIEVIRGPASLMYGSDAMGGVINIITKKNPDKITGGVQLDTRLSEDSRFGNIYGVNAYLSSPIVDKVLSFNLRGGYRYGEQNSFKKPAGLTQSGASANNPYASWSATGYQNWNAGGRLNWTINENNNIYFDAESYFVRTGSLNTSANAVTAIRDHYRINSVLNHDANYNWGSLTSYFQYTQTFWAPHAGVPIGGSKGSSINWASKSDNKDVVLNSTYHKDFDFDSYGVLNLNAGINYLYELFNDRSTKYEKDIHQASIFAEGEYIPFEYISTTLGLRYNYSNLFNSIPNPRFYLNVNPTSWLTFKAGVTSGTMMPGIQQLYDGYTLSSDGQTATYGNRNLKPEQSWNYEISAIADTKYIFASVTGYYTDFRDQIESYTITQNGCVATNCVYYRNIAKSLMAGAELALRLKPIYGFSLDTSYAFTHTQVLSNTAGTPRGEPVNNIARHNFTIKPAYKYEDFDVYIRWSGKFKTPTTYSTTATSDRVVVGKYYKDYQLVDIGASYRFLENYSVTFAINNLFNVDFIDFKLYSNNTRYANNYQRILPSRSYWLTFKADF